MSALQAQAEEADVQRKTAITKLEWAETQLREVQGKYDELSAQFSSADAHNAGEMKGIIHCGHERLQIRVSSDIRRKRNS